MGCRFSLYEAGTNWDAYADDGDVSYLYHLAVSIWNFSAQTERLSGRIWATGRPFLSSLTISSILTTALLQTTKTKTFRAPQSSTPHRDCRHELAIGKDGRRNSRAIYGADTPNQKDGDMPFILGGICTMFTGYIFLVGIPFPALLLSAGDLVTLKLDKISQTGYISPEAIVTLAALTRLKTVYIRLQSPTSCPDLRNLRCLRVFGWRS